MTITINHHHYIHGSRDELKDLLHLIIKKISMSQEVLGELKALADKAATSLDNIKADITRIAGGINPAGGLTEAEATELKDKLTALAVKADSLDKENEEVAPV